MNQIQLHNDKISKIIKFLIGYPSVRTWKKHFNLISAQIYFTANGIKDGYLWDAGPKINLSTLQHLLSELVKLELIPETLELCELFTEMFILNQNKLNALIQDLTTLNIALVDVTKTLDKPMILNRSDVIIGKLIKVISGKNITEVPCEICVPTLVGILIGYPIVYWYNSEVSDENNLNNCTLKVYQLNHNESVIYSFSVPCELLNQSNILSRTVECWLDEKLTHGLQLKTFTTEMEYVIL